MGHVFQLGGGFRGEQSGHAARHRRGVGVDGVEDGGEVSHRWVWKRGRGVDDSGSTGRRGGEFWVEVNLPVVGAG